ncbi:hypothetical protein HZ994_10085 [Akkermansiaceae bacterium]|nr:hypothetical protein HZ994_10085 [Akkermansiaceae bacterium]
MKRQMLRGLLAGLIVALTFAAARIWTAEYDSEPDPKARFVVVAAQVSSDKGYRWVEVHLKRSGDAEHDLRKRVRLVTAEGTEHEPADTTFAGSPEKGFTDIWFKFWLAERDLEGKLDLRANDGSLRVKTNSGPPSLGSDGKAVFKSADWGKSWLGF